MTFRSLFLVGALWVDDREWEFVLLVSCLGMIEYFILAGVVFSTFSARSKVNEMGWNRSRSFRAKTYTEHVFDRK